MRVFGPASARPAPDDRNPLKVNAQAQNTPGAAAQADTDDWSYTVPAGRRCRVESAQTSVANDSATALNARALSRISFEPGGTPPSPENRVVDAELETGQASTRASGIAGPQITMLPGDQLFGRSLVSNNAAGSNVRTYSSFTGTEYDA